MVMVLLLANWVDKSPKPPANQKPSPTHLSFASDPLEHARSWHSTGKRAERREIDKQKENKMWNVQNVT